MTDDTNDDGTCDCESNEDIAVNETADNDTNGGVESYYDEADAFDRMGHRCDYNGHPYPCTVTTLMDDVAEHGEVHVTVEEHDAELEVRLGTTVFDFDGQVVRVEQPSGTTRNVLFDRIVDWYKPNSLWE